MFLNDSINDSSDCIVLTPEYSAKLLEAVNDYLLTAQGIIVSGILVSSAILTIFFMAVVVMNKELHKRTFIISLELLFLDLVLVLFLHFPIVTTAFAHKWIFGSVWCFITGAISSLVTYLRSSILFVLTLDRFLTVFYPFRYEKVARKVLTVISIIFFIICLTVAVIPAFVKECYKFSSTALFCVSAGECNVSKYVCYTNDTIGFIILLIFGALLPIGMYIAMYIKAKKIQSSVPQLGECEIEANTINQYKHKSNQQAKTTVLILFVCLICLSFPLFINIIYVALVNTATYHLYITYIINDLFFSFPIADAIILWRNRDIKDKLIAAFNKFKHKIKN